MRFGISSSLYCNLPVIQISSFPLVFPLESQYMKEQIIYLTTKAQNPYAGNITTMANNTSQETPPPPKKETRQQPPASSDRVKKTLEAWEKEFKKRERKGEKISADEREMVRHMIERGIMPIAGRAEELPSAEDLGISNDALKNIIAQINEYARQLGDERGFPQAFLEEQRKRVEKLVDEGRVPQNEVNQAMRLIGTLNEQFHAAEEADERTEEERMRKRGELGADLDRIYLLATELQTEFKATNYSRFPEVARIATEVEQALAPGSKQATNGFFEEKIDKLVKLVQGSSTGDHGVVEEAGRLIDALQLIKDVLSSKITSERQKREHNLYGEIRLSTAEEKDIVQNAIDSIKKKGTAEGDLAERRLQKEFNKLFVRGDVNANKEWRDALGSAGSIESDLFLITLANAAAGRTYPLGQELSPEEINILNQKARELQQQSEIREFLHNVSYYANRNANIEELHRAMTRFPMESLDIAYNTKGVSQMSHFFEQAMFRVMAKNGWYLPYEAMVNNVDGSYGEVEQIVYDMADKARKTGILDEDMQDWEIKRAVSLARGLNIATGRTFEIVAFGGLPKETPLVSWWANNVIKRIAFFKQIARYNVGYERNRILAYKLDEKSFSWNPKELKEMSAIQIVDRFGTESEKDVLMDQDNPTNIGSIYTQTGWRWGKDEITVAGVVSDLLNKYPLNPLIGIGMWLEKERKMWSNPVNKEWHASMEADEKRDLLDMFGDEAAAIKSKGQRAGFVIRKNLELAADITPLKLFYNLHGLRADVLLKHYSSEVVEDIEESAITHERKGQILFRSNNAGRALSNDFSSLALAQESLLGKRVKAYQDWVNAGRKKEERPNFYTQYADLETEIREIFKGVKPEENRTEQVIALARHIKEEFLLYERPIDRDNLNKGMRGGHLETLMNNLRHKGWKIPWVFGTDDIPYNLFNFAKTGGSSLDRRWGDIESAEKAVGGMEQLIMKMTEFHTQDDIIKALNEIYQALRGHDEGVAAATIFRLSEGIIKFYKKDVLSRLPAGLGEFLGFVGGEASFAQIAYGRQQMAWDEIDIDSFLKRLHAAGLLGEGDLGLERIEILRDHTGAEKWNMAIAISRTAGGLGLLGFLYWFFLQTFPSELKKAA